MTIETLPLFGEPDHPPVTIPPAAAVRWSILTHLAAARPLRSAA